MYDSAKVDLHGADSGKGHLLRAKRLTAGAMTLAATAAGIVAVALPSSAAASARKVTLVGSGSSAAQTYLQDLFAAYHRQHGNVNFTYNPDGGNADIRTSRTAARSSPSRRASHRPAPSTRSLTSCSWTR